MDIKQIKSRLSALQSSSSSGKKEKIDYTKYYWKPKQEGKYQIRFVPSKFDKQNPFREMFVHYGIGKFPIFSLVNWGEKDPIVEFAKQLRSTNDKENWKLSKKLDPKLRIYAPVIVRGEEHKGVRLWEFGKEIYLQLLGIAEDEDYGDYTDIKEGRDFTVEAVMGDIGGRQGLKSSIRVKPKTSVLSDNKTEIEEWLENQPDVLQLQRKMEFDAMKEVLQNWLAPTAEETEEVESSDEEEADLPWEKDTAKPSYSVKSSGAIKPKSKVDEFDELFEEEEN
jgi:hypothetical protein